MIAPGALRRQVRLQGPLHAITETILSIHTPDPHRRRLLGSTHAARDGPESNRQGDAPVRERQGKRRLARRPDPRKVSGVLKAEGAIVGNFVKDGRYTVTGEQHYDPRSREWKKASWSVDVANELANAAGVTVANAKGKMTVDSKMLGNGQSPA